MSGDLAGHLSGGMARALGRSARDKGHPPSELLLIAIGTGERV